MSFSFFCYEEKLFCFVIFTFCHSSSSNDFPLFSRWFSFEFYFFALFWFASGRFLGAKNYFRGISSSPTRSSFWKFMVHVTIFWQFILCIKAFFRTFHSMEFISFFTHHAFEMLEVEVFFWRKAALKELVFLNPTPKSKIFKYLFSPKRQNI